ncbi:MAG: hypothetical protein ACJAZO_002032 [Myxococcota bacterium]|jgi:hypothetical protein
MTLAQSLEETARALAAGEVAADTFIALLDDVRRAADSATSGEVLTLHRALVDCEPLLLSRRESLRSAIADTVKSGRAVRGFASLQANTRGQRVDKKA